tara:strand:+ start:655 stop:933 length:279 start_codon:yes stop_codon:yes gene_type:complete
MIKLKELVKYECDCGGDCCGLNEAAGDTIKANKKLQRLMKDESSFRLHMYELVKIISKEDVNKSLTDDIMTTYKKNVTNFMRTAVKAVKKMK